MAGFKLLICRIALCALLCAGLSSVSLAASSVKDVRLWAGPEGTRVVFDLVGEVTHKVFVLDHPARLVVDLPATRLDMAGRSMPDGQGVVRAVRAAERGDGVLRVVLDLTKVVEQRTFVIAGSREAPPRLVLDLDTVASGSKPSLPAATPAVPQSPVVVKSLPTSDARDLVIAVDAGHGGKDPGALGRRGAREKDITLGIARLLKARIDAEPGMRAILTRDSDHFISLGERVRRARQQQADMFISIHADAVPNRTVSGSSVYVLSARGASDEASRWLAERENAADLVGGASLDGKDDVLASVLLDLSQGASMSASIEAAGRVLQNLDRVGKVHYSDVKHAGFVVLKAPDIPSMLVETAFISNPAEEVKLTDRRHQQKLADAILAGVRDYFYDNPPPGTRVAQMKAQRQARNDAAAGKGADGS